MLKAADPVHLRFSPLAQNDLRELWLKVASENESAADRAIDRIEKSCEHLLEFPHSGRACPDIRAGARMLVVRPWLLPYLIEGQTIHVLRVVDGRRDRRSWERTLG